MSCDDCCYSWDVGNAHFVVFSTEVYYYTEYGGVELIEQQYNWLEQDLKVSYSTGATIVLCLSYYLF